ncbi:hypothetical protein HMN09_00919300 [Mycena chlorophos]|uniref:Uncharacterized protein n=1 Tax=Mycena chlorophos TaxID=658473 RepID=A0A8H6SK94_MYCCL|nr:hypothetical protein HMN09_00919300 [Mycena chlorophos]
MPAAHLLPIFIPPFPLNPNDDEAERWLDVCQLIFLRDGVPASHWASMAYAAFPHHIREELDALLHQSLPGARVVRDLSWTQFTELIGEYVAGKQAALVLAEKQHAPRGWFQRVREEHPAAVAAAAVGITVVATVAAPLVLVGVIHAIGFGSSGVVAASIAAGLQSAIGNVAAGSLFAICQSIGAGGAALAVAAPVAAAAGGVGGGIVAGKMVDGIDWVKVAQDAVFSASSMRASGLQILGNLRRGILG